MKKILKSPTIFWSKVDLLLKSMGSNLTKLSNDTGIDYGTLALQRHRKIFPKIDQLLSMALYFNITLDELLSVQEEETEEDLRLKRIILRLSKAKDPVLFCIEKLLDIPVEKELPIGKSILTNDKSLEGKD